MLLVSAASACKSTKVVSIRKRRSLPIKEAIDNSLSPGSQSFERALLDLLQAESIRRDEALANADSATNPGWLINIGPENAAPRETTPSGPPSLQQLAASSSFTEFTLDHKML